MTLAVLASLLVFPSAVPWMAGGWLVGHVVFVFLGQAGWVPLAICSAVLIIKGVDWPATLYLHVTLMLIVGLVRGIWFHKQGRRMGAPIDSLGLAALGITWMAFASSWYAAAQCSHTPALTRGHPVVCLGDSLTAYGYPEQLAKLISLPVINEGANGITTSDALQRLPAIGNIEPQAVVIELGGHDFRRGLTRAAAKANLEQLITECRSYGAEVILMEIPRGFIFDPYWGLERQLAREHDLQLIADTAIRQLVLWSPYAPPGIWVNKDWHLSDDGLHPNARGNELLARYVAEALIALYGRDIQVRPKSD